MIASPTRAPARALALAAALAVALAAAPTSAHAALTLAQRSRMSALVRATLAAGRYPGMVVGVWTPHGAFVGAFGARTLGRGGHGAGRERDAGARLSVADRFRVGSVTKTMTATVVLRLVHERRLSLSTPLSAFYPGILDARRITIRELLDHTSLIPDLDRATPESLLRAPHQRFDVAEVIGAALTQPFFAPPWAKLVGAQTIR